MTPDLDSLATALYAETDDLLKGSPQLAPWRPAVGIAPKLTDAELVTLAMMQAMLGFLALTAAIWHNDYMGQPVLRSLTAYDH